MYSLYTPHPDSNCKDFANAHRKDLEQFSFLSYENFYVHIVNSSVHILRLMYALCAHKGGYKNSIILSRK